jgi:hypothetical protein
MIKLKDETVNVKNLKKVISCKVLGLANICKSIEGEKYVMTITSGNDAVHMVNSKHYTDEAIDIRNRDMKNSKVVAQEMAEYLGKDYDVVHKKTHIHIEYDPK